MIIIDGIPPSVNDYWKRSRNGGIYLTPKAKEWKYLVLAAWNSLPRHERRKATEATVSLDIEIHFPTAHHSDLDNRLKAIADSLEGLLYDSDYFVREIHVKRGAGKPGLAKTYIRWSY